MMAALGIGFALGRKIGDTDWLLNLVSKGGEKRRFWGSILFREEKGEEDGVWDWNLELGFREKGREIEREDSKLGLWVSGLLFTV